MAGRGQKNRRQAHLRMTAIDGFFIGDSMIFLAFSSFSFGIGPRARLPIASGSRADNRIDIRPT